MVMHIREFVQKPPDNPFYAVIGHPVAHSRSPLIHNFALRYHNLPETYHALDTPHDSFAWVGKLLDLPGFRGLNVTIPHKRRIMDVLNVTDPLAQAVGAVNTVCQHPVGFAGYNTDVAGLERSLNQFRLFFAMQKAVILGSGGAARAAAASLKNLGISKAVIITRNTATADWPSHINKTPVTLAGYNALGDTLKDAVLVINTTPVGMYPDVDNSPIPENLAPMLRNKVCMDAIYNPAKTLFLYQAKEAGAHAVVSGVKMFIGQAAAAFQLWTEKTFPSEEAEKLLMQSP